MINRPQSRPQPEARVARTLEEVLAAWRLVHEAYVAKAIIEPNQFHLHTNLQATCPGALVICGDTAGELTSTLTIVPDGSLGLPLDDVFQTELDTLRDRGVRLSEFGLFTHRISALPLQMLAASIDTALPDAGCAIAVGVHPRHVGFYRRAFGFVQSSDVRQYTSLQSVPVCLLYIDRLAFQAVQRPRWGEPSGKLAHQLKPEQAFDFAPSAWRGTALGHYLDSRTVAPKPPRHTQLAHPENVSARIKEQASP